MAKGYKTGGRQKGTANKSASEIREYLRGIIEGELDALPKALVKLEPARRVEIVTKLMPYVLARANPEPLHQECQPEVVIQRYPMLILEQIVKRELDAKSKGETLTNQPQLINGREVTWQQLKSIHEIFPWDPEDSPITIRFDIGG